jgi:hypothetical protein
MTRLRTLCLPLAVLTLSAAPLGAQELELTTDLLDRFVTAHDKEREDLAALDPQLAEIDEKIRKFRECKIAFEVAGSASGSRLGGLAARAGIRARCGANSEAEIERQKTTLRTRTTAAAAQAGSLTVPQFTRLRTRLERIYLYGDRAGLREPELVAVDARRERFASVFGASGVSGDLQAVADAVASLGGAGTGGARTMPGQWTADISWMFISQMFGMMYATGASVFEGAYEPGQWTRWTMKSAGDEDDRYSVERAFLTRTADGGEWWRFRSVTVSGSGARATADTIVLEGLFKPQGEGVQQLVRMRGKMPGDREANEMMVPQNMSIVSSLGGFGMRPTKESIEGATVGTERVATEAGSFLAKLVRFGGPGGKQEWWLIESVPGGWVRYRASRAEGDDAFTMELVAHGTGARSELGVP